MKGMRTGHLRSDAGALALSSKARGRVVPSHLIWSGLTLGDLRWARLAETPLSSSSHSIWSVSVVLAAVSQSRRHGRQPASAGGPRKSRPATGGHLALATAHATRPATGSASAASSLLADHPEAAGNAAAIRPRRLGRFWHGGRIRNSAKDARPHRGTYGIPAWRA
jgi:hypothetical protein